MEKNYLVFEDNHTFGIFKRISQKMHLKVF